MITDPSYACRGGRYNHGCRCDLCRVRERERARAKRARQKARVDQLVKHGPSGYSNHGCRCDICTEAVRAQKARRRARTDELVSHGVNGYRNWGCRCAACTSAHSTWAAERRRVAKSVDRSAVPHGSSAGYSEYGCRCEECRKANYAGYKRLNEASRDAARNHAKLWTGPELEFLSRDISLDEASQALGRTREACREMRKKLKVDPRKQALL